MELSCSPFSLVRLYIAERPGQADLFTFPNSLFLSTQILLTGWSSDAFDVVKPTGQLGKAVALACVVYGLFVFFWLLALLSEWLVPTAAEREAIKIFRIDNLQARVRTTAAVVIQRWWRMDAGASRRDLNSARWRFVTAKRELMKFTDRFGGACSDESAADSLASQVAELKTQVQQLATLLQAQRVPAVSMETVSINH